MNKQMKDLNGDFKPDDARVADLLERTAQQIELNPGFQSALEGRLKDAYGTKGTATMSLRKMMPAIVGAIALIILAIVLDWAFRSMAPKTIPGAGGTSTPASPAITSEASTPTPIAVSATVYQWRGTSLTLSVPLPDSPAEANVYLLNKDKPATLEEARALAARFGIQSETYIASGDIPSANGFIFTDGKQMLMVHSNFYWNYTSDIIKNYNRVNASFSPNAEKTITEFLNSHGFNFPFKVQGGGLRGGYDVRPISPDGLPMQYEYFGGPVMNIALDENGQVLNVQANLMDYSQTPIGTFGIISAKEALQRMLDDNVQAGKIEGMSSASGSTQAQEWERAYPIDQTITIYGYRSLIPALDPNQSPFIQIDAYPIFGNIEGLAQLKGNGKQPDRPYIQATGQFVMENGIEKFNVESWKAFDVNVEDGWAGTLERENGQAYLTVEIEGGGASVGDRYMIPDVPDSIPMPFEHAFVVGTKIGDVIEWKLIDNRMVANAGGGGGGGGGLGFYQLNLSGTPVPFPTSQPTPQFGGSSKQIYKIQPGDTLSKIASEFGVSVDALAQVNGISDPSMFYVGQTLVIPSAASTSQQHQLLTGTQKVTQINNQTVILFSAEDGKTYVQAGPDGNPNNAVLIGREGDKVSLEAVIASDQTFDGYPVLLVSAGGLAGQWGGGGGGPIENLPPTPDISNTPTAPENYTPPSLTIEKAELVYLVSNPLYQPNDPAASRRSPYFQPAWHFSGHNSNGDAFDILIQALKQEYLSPGIAPYIQGG